MNSLRKKCCSEHKCAREGENIFETEIKEFYEPIESTQTN